MQPQHFFLITAFLFGITYALIVPPFQAPDEFNHFYRSWQITEGGVIATKTPDNRLGGTLPSSLVSISKPFSQLPFHFNNRIKTDTIFQSLKVPLNVTQRNFVDFANTAVYAPTAYIAQFISIFLLKKIGLTPLSIFYLARIFTLFIWLSIIYVSILTIPIHRWVWATLALLPSSLFINSSLSADTITNAFSFLSISLFIKLFFEKKKMTKGQALTLFITTSIISVNKIAYFPIVFLTFLIPKENFSVPKNKAVFSAMLILVNIFVIIYWTQKVNSLYIRFEDYNPLYRTGQQLNEGVNPKEQLSFIIHNPLIFSRILGFSLFKTLPHTLIHYVGKFGWEKNYLHLFLIFPLLTMLILRGCFEPNNVWQSRNIRNLKCYLGLIGAMMSLSFATVMYILWCPVGSEFIENLGGKYFIPIFPLFFLALPSFKPNKFFFLISNKALAVCLWLTLSCGIWQVWVRYYV